MSDETTQPFTQKYTLVQLLEELPEGTEYDWRVWPPHITLADVFSITWDVPTLVSELTQLLNSQASITATAKDTAYLGQQRTKVVLIEPNSELLDLHYDLVALLENGGVKFNNPEFIRSGFLPHSTAQGEWMLKKGEHVHFTALSLIDMFPDSDPYRRKVLKTIPFRRLV